MIFPSEWNTVDFYGSPFYMMAMKICMTCREEKPLTAFYRHNGMADGHLNKCKECCKEAVRKNRAANLEYYRAYDKNRFLCDPRVRERQARYRKTKAGKEAIRKAGAKWQDNNREKRAAHVILGNAVKNGRVTKASACENCGAPGRLNGHHHDYARPLEVKWLCPACHRKEHQP